MSEKYKSLEDLPQGALVGTSSLRRQAQILARRPDLLIAPLRGNVDTRLERLKAGNYDAIVLATSGLFRLGLHARHMVPFETDEFVPAVGQGALGIECQEDNYQLLALLAHLEDRDSRVCVQAERSFLRRLDGGCQAPIAAHAVFLDEENINLQGLVATPNGTQLLRVQQRGDAIDSQKIGEAVASKILGDGADRILQQLYGKPEK